MRFMTRNLRITIALHNVMIVFDSFCSTYLHRFLRHLKIDGYLDRRVATVSLAVVYLLHTHVHTLTHALCKLSQNCQHTTP